MCIQFLSFYQDNSIICNYTNSHTPESQADVPSVCVNFWNNAENIKHAIINLISASYKLRVKQCCHWVMFNGVDTAVRSSNGAQSWQQQNSLTTKQLHCHYQINKCHDIRQSLLSSMRTRRQCKGCSVSSSLQNKGI